MNNFKQIAGLIILVFILAIFFVIFLTNQDEKKRERVFEESVQRDAMTHSQLELCIQEAEQKKSKTKQSRLSQLLAAERSGYYYTLKEECLAKNPLTRSNDAQLNEIWNKKCVANVEKFFLKEAELDQELIEAKGVCNERFLR